VVVVVVVLVALPSIVATIRITKEYYHRPCSWQPSYELLLSWAGSTPPTCA
jgi:hypothetical protein